MVSGQSEQAAESCCASALTILIFRLSQVDSSSPYSSTRHCSLKQHYTKAEMACNQARLADRDVWSVVRFKGRLEPSRDGGNFESPVSDKQ